MTLTLDELARRVQRLEDLAEIRALKARYLRGCDLKLPEVVRDTLAPEGATIAYDGFPAFNDRDAFVKIFQEMGCVPGIFDIHHATNAELELTSQDEATGAWSLNFQSINLAAKTVTQMGVEYQDRYIRKDGRWWISQTKTKRTSCIIHQVDTEGYPQIVAMGDAPDNYGDAS